MVTSTKRRFKDYEHSTERYYALFKHKNHVIIRMDYCVRNGQIRIINAFKAGATDCERYQMGEDF